MIFKTAKNTDAEAIEYLNKLNAQHLQEVTNKLDNIFQLGIRTIDDVYKTNTLLIEYKNITGKEYKYIKEDSIV